MGSPDLVCRPDDEQRLQTILHQLETQATNFATRTIKDAAVRQQYLRAIKSFSEQVLDDVRSGRVHVSEAVVEANNARNSIMEAARLRSSDIGRAKAEQLKLKGKTLPQLQEHYANKLFKKPFSKLSTAQQNRVYLEIIEASGRARPSATRAATRLGRLGRGLWVLTIGIAVYNVATADNKVEAAAREGAVIGGGVLGGAAGGAAAGLVCGPGAPVCVTIGVFVGGALGALGIDLAWDAAKAGGGRPAHAGGPWSNPNKVCCFPADVRVWTPQGKRRIVDVGPGEEVFTAHPVHGVARARVWKTERHQGRFVRRQITVENGAVEVTHGHRIDSVHSWLPVEHIEPGSPVASISGARVVAGVSDARWGGAVYNLRLDGADTFFVGENGLLVRED